MLNLFPTEDEVSNELKKSTVHSSRQTVKEFGDGNYSGFACNLYVYTLHYLKVICSASLLIILLSITMQAIGIHANFCHKYAIALTMDSKQDITLFLLHC